MGLRNSKMLRNLTYRDLQIMGGQEVLIRTRGQASGRCETREVEMSFPVVIILHLTGFSLDRTLDGHGGQPTSRESRALVSTAVDHSCYQCLPKLELVSKRPLVVFRARQDPLGMGRRTPFCHHERSTVCSIVLH